MEAASRCPLCGEANRCAMAVARETGAPQPPCWCLEAEFSPALLDRVPAAARGRACICARCGATQAEKASAPAAPRSPGG
ncbi:MAG: cysteine-rich CWC family protein [Variovorax sp.]